MEHYKGICNLSVVPIRKEASDASELVTQLLFGESFKILERYEKWHYIQIDADGYKGWIDPKNYELYKEPAERTLLKKGAVYQTHNNLILSCGSQVEALTDTSFQLNGKYYNYKLLTPTLENESWEMYALAYLNVPYLWGGRSIFGIDCSGFTQLIYSYKGIQLPRDASQQLHEGEPVEWENRQAGDLAFFQNDKGKITHVGLLLNMDLIVHASGRVRIDYILKKGILHTQNLNYTHELFCIKRKKNFLI